MKANLHTLVVGVSILALSGCQTTTDNSVHAAREPVSAAANATINGADREFIMQAEKDSIQERVLGRMAEETSQNSGIKAYGKMLAKDHNDALLKLVELMKKYDIAQPQTLPHERTDAIRKTQGLLGSAFDREFVNIMVKDHQKAVDTFRHEAQAAQNADVRDYARNMVPMLETHLKAAQSIQKALSAKRG
jgi:putative membrane protein